MRKKNFSKLNVIGVGTIAVFFTMAMFKVHVSNQIVMLGYEIGKLKSHELELLEEQSQLKVQLAKLTTREHLSLMTDSTSPQSQTSVKVAAAQ